MIKVTHKYIQLASIVVLTVLSLLISGCGKPTEEELQQTILNHIKENYDVDVLVLNKELAPGNTGLDKAYYVYTLKHPYSNTTFEAYIETNGKYLGDNFPKSLYYDDVHNIMKSIIYLLEGNEAAAKAHEYVYEYHYILSDKTYRSLHEYLKNSESFLSLDITLNEGSTDASIAKLHALIEELVLNDIQYSITANIYIDNAYKEVNLSYHKGDDKDYTDAQDIRDKILKN